MRTIPCIALAALLGAGLTTTPATAQEPKKDQGGLELRIRTDKEAFLLGEPIVLYISLRNAGAGPVEVARLLEPEYDYVRYRVKRPDGEVVTFVPWAIKEHPEPQRSLAAGESVQDAARIFYGGQGWTFREPGRYEITANYREMLPSNTLTVTINRPEDPAAARAAERFLGSDEAGRFMLLEGGDHLTQGMQSLSQVIQESPNTPHADYANYALGANMLNDFANFKENTVRKAEPRTASTYLERSKARSPGLFLRARSDILLMDAYTKLNDPEKIEATRRDLERMDVEPGMRRWVEDAMRKRGLNVPK